MGGSSTQTQQTTTAPTALAGQNYTSAINQAAQLATTPYNTATDTQVAGLTQPQTTAFGQLQSAYGTAQPYLSQATNYANAAADPATVQNNIQGFENPYTSSVINSSLALANQQNQQQQQQLQSSAASAGALGGDRLGVAQGVLGGQQALANNQLISGLNQQNYSQALGASQQNAAAQGQSAYTLGNLGQEALNTDITGAQAGLSAGNQLQAQQQNVLNSGTQNAVQQTQFPYQNTQYLASILGSLGPLLGGTTQGTTTTPVNYLGQILGAGLAGASLIPSDKRVKEDIQPIGKTFDGQTITKFRYKGDNTTRIGLIAQDVEKKHPDSVSEINGIKAVDYDKATESSAKKGHFANGGMVPFRQHRDTGGSVFNLNSGPYGMSDALSAGRGNFPSLPQTPSNQNNANSFGSQIQQMSQMASLGKSAAPGLSNLNNALGTSVFGSQSTQGPGGWSTSVQPSGGFLGGIGDSLGFAKGGQVKGYDDGGTVTPDDALLGIPAGSSPLSFSDAGNWLARQSGYQNPFSSANASPMPNVVAPSVPNQISPDSPLATMPATPFSPSELDQVANQYNAPVVPSLTNENLFKDMPAETSPAPVTSLGQTSSPAPAQFSGTTPVSSSVQDQSSQQNSQGGMSSYFPKLRAIESGGNDSAQAATSSAYGPYQFTKGTWNDVAAKHPELGLTAADRFDPQKQQVAIEAFTKDNAFTLASNGIDPADQTNLYMAHLLGPAGGTKFLTAMQKDPSAPAASVVNPDQVAANQSLFYNKDGTAKSLSDVYGGFQNKFSNAGGSSSSDAVINSSPQQKTSFLSRLGLIDPAGAEATPEGKGILAKLGVPDVNPLGLSDNQRNSLLMAGLSMMAAGPAMGTRSPIGALTTVGKGAVQGMNTYLTEQQQEKVAQAKAAQLAQQAQQHQQELALKVNHELPMDAMRLKMEAAKLTQPVVVGEYTDQFGQTHKQYANPVYDPKTQTLTYPQSGASAAQSNQQNANNGTTSDQATGSTSAAKPHPTGAQSIDAISNPNGLKGEDYLKTLSPAMANRARMLGDYEAPALTGKSAASPQGEMEQMAAKAYNPDYDQTQYAAKQQAKKDWTTGNTKKTLQNGNTGLGHLFDLTSSIDDIGNTSYPDYNTARNWTRQRVGDPRAATFDANAGHVAEELTSFYRGAGGAEADIKRSLADLNTAQSPEQAKSVIDRLTNMVADKVDSLKQSRDWAYGEDKGAKQYPILTPRAQQQFDLIKEWAQGNKPMSQIMADRGIASVNQSQSPQVQLKSERPANFTDDQLREKAQQSIVKGTPASSVNAQLQAWGVNP